MLTKDNYQAVSVLSAAADRPSGRYTTHMAATVVEVIAAETSHGERGLRA